MEKTESAIVLQRRKLGDTDLMVTLFLEQGGKRSGIAKGALRSRRRFGNCFDIGAHLSVTYRERPHQELLLLEEGVLQSHAIAWRASWPTIVAAEYALELVTRTLPEQKSSP